MAKIKWVSHGDKGYMADPSTIMGKVIDESKLPLTVVVGRGKRIMRYIGEAQAVKRQTTVTSSMMEVIGMLATCVI